MGLMEELKQLGVNTDEAIARMNGKTALYERMLVKYADILKNSIVLPDFDCNHYEDVVEAAHAIKGTSGNLSVTPIYQAYSEIVRLLRAGRPQEAKAVLNQIMPVQMKIVQCIDKYS